MPQPRAAQEALQGSKASEATQVVLAKIKDQRRPGYIRTSERFRYPQRPAKMPQRRGESDKDYAVRIDAAREEAYERARRRLRRY
jgi:hypothetical protein